METPKFEIVKEGKENFLVIKVKLPVSKKDAETSKSGKSLMYATTNGNNKSGLKVNGDDLIIGFNAYTKIEK